MASIYVPQFLYQIDWDGDGDFSEDVENVTQYVISANWELGSHKPFQYVADEAKLTLVLNNADRRFSPEYSDSPLAGMVLPRRKVQVRLYDIVFDNLGNVVFDNNGDPVLVLRDVMYSGWISTINPTWGIHKGPFQTTIEASGSKGILDRARITIPIMTSARTDTIIQAILDASLTGYNAITYDLSAGLVTHAYAGDSWDSDTTAYQALVSAVQAEWGIFYFDRDGTAVFRTRDWLTSEDDITLTITDDEGDEMLYGMKYRFGQDIANVINVEYFPRTVSTVTTDVLYTMPSSITITPGGTYTFKASYTSTEGQTVGGTNVSTPSTGASTLHFSSGSATVTTFTANATGFEILLTNNSAVANCVVDVLIVKGRKLTSFAKQTATSTDSTSVGLYGEAQYTISSKLLGDPDLAKTLADFILSYRANPQGYVTEVSVISRSSALATLMPSIVIGNKIRVTEQQTGTERDYRVVGERHEVSDGGNIYVVTWSLDPLPNIGTWTLDVDELDFTAVLGV